MSKVTVSGPITDGRALRAADRMLTTILTDVAQDVEDEVHAALGDFLQNPTGFYESRIRISTVGVDRSVHDSGVVYGPWLAGVSSRNQTSRFKGYAHWRRATQRAQAKVVRTAQPGLRRGVKEMNR